MDLRTRKQDPGAVRDLDETTDMGDSSERVQLLSDHGTLTVEIYKTAAHMGQELTKAIAGIGDLDALQAGVDAIKFLNEKRAKAKERLADLGVHTTLPDSVVS